jgi:hypothetical protein
MGGGLLQLVAYGAQDVYLTGNPQITFFKVVYRRHTNFAMEAIQQTFSGVPGYGNTVYCQISRNGDLIHRTYLEVSLPALTSADKYVNYVGLRLLKSVTIEIGGQQIDKHYSDWLYIWNELSLPMGKKSAWEYMVGADSDITSPAASVLYIPLEFWFCRNIGLALPLIALQYHEVKVKIEFESANNCVYKVVGSDTLAPDTAPVLTSANLWVDYIFLDTDERRKFAQLSHEYLIEQLQFTGQETLNASGSRVKLNFNHPCKELIWVAKFNNSLSVNQWYNYTVDATADASAPTKPTGATKFSGEVLNYTAIDQDIASSSNADLSTFGYTNFLPYNIYPGLSKAAINPFNSCLLQLNGNDRFAERDGTYFNYVQPFQHHTNIPTNAGINVYSFALKPEEHQPSGTLNMSRIDTAVLGVTVPSSVSGLINIYATNYNVLRILSGMGGLAYSN